MRTSYNILIADDHQLFLDGLKLIFSNNDRYKIIAEANNGEDVLKALKTMPVDIAILDMNMPKPNGMELAKIIKKEYPDCKVIILSMYGEEAFMTESMKIGVSAYLLKNAGREELLLAISEVLRSNTYISKELRSTKELSSDHFVKSLSLTKREIEIISLLAKEKSSQEIADELFLSIYTVNTHRKNILHKLGIKNSAGLVKFAIDNNLI